MWEKAIKAVLSIIGRKEVLENLPEDFVANAQNWIRIKILGNDPVMEKLITSDKPDIVKESLIEAKLEDLQNDATFQYELQMLVKDYQIHIENSKNAVVNSSINAKGNVQIGDVINHYYNTPTNPAQPVANAPEMVRNIRQLIATNRIPEALSLILQHSENQSSQMYNEALQVSLRWEGLSHKERIGIISNADANIERNQIVAVLLEMISRFT